MSDGATLNLVRSVMADRTGRLYGGPVRADEQITDETQLFARAIGVAARPVARSVLDDGSCRHRARRPFIQRLAHCPARSH